MPIPISSLSSYRQAARSLGAKSAGALAAGAGLLAAPEALAQISVYTPTSGNVTDGVTNKYIWFNFLTDQTSNSSFGGLEGYVYADRSRVYLRSQEPGIEFTVNSTPVPRSPGDVYDSATPLTVGTPVNGGNFSYRGFLNVYAGDPATIWNNRTGYVGFRIPATGGGFYYGWVNLTTDQYATTVSFNSFAVNHTPNGAITAGETGAAPVPEPAMSAALLAIGAAGIAGYRRRKNLRRAAV